MLFCHQIYRKQHVSRGDYFTLIYNKLISVVWLLESTYLKFLLQFVILLCAGSYVSGIAVHSGTQSAATKSQATTSGAAQQQDHLALPSQASYQKAAATSSNYLPNSASFQVNSAVVDSISEATPVKNVPVQTYGSPNVQQPTVTISASVATDPSSSEYNNILERYAPAVNPIKPYFAAPVAAKTVSIGSQGAGTAGQDAQVDNKGYITRPFVVYNNNVAQSGQYYAVPYAQTLLDSQRSANVPSHSTQGTQYGAPAVANPSNSASSAPRPFYPPSAAILESHGDFAAPSPGAASYQVNKVQAVNLPSPPQYVPAPKIIYNVKPAVQLQTVSVPTAPKKVTIEQYNSVLTHPPPAPKYAPASIPVPVIFQQVATNQPAAPQFAVLTNTVVPTAASYAQVPVGVEAVPVPVYTSNGGRLQYHPIPVTGGHQHGYAKAVLFSPASEVSRVIFNGLGVSYGW